MYKDQNHSFIKYKDDYLGFCKYCFESRNLSYNTVNAHFKSFYNYLFSFTSPETLSQSDIDKFINDKPKTNVPRSFIKNYLKYRKLTKVLELPDKVARKPQPKFIPQEISEEEIIKISNYLKKISLRRYFLFNCEVQMAMRLEEAINLKLNNFHWKEFIQNNFSKPLDCTFIGKGNKTRTCFVSAELGQEILFTFVPLHHQIWAIYPVETLKGEVLKCFREDLLKIINQDENLVNSKKIEGQNVTKNTWYRFIKKISLKAIGREIRSHQFRRYRLCQLLDKKGIDLIDVSNYAGHSNITTTMIYVKRKQDISRDRIKDKLSEETKDKSSGNNQK